MARADVACWLPGLRGRLGPVVFVRGPQGTVMRERPRSVDPRTPAQLAARARARAVGLAWRGLTAAELDAWRDYAAGLGPAVSAQNAFFGLGVRALLAGAEGVPTVPPAETFLGDSVRLVAAGGLGEVRVEAFAANGEGVVTELLLQPLASPKRRIYLERYRSARVVAFAGPSFESLPAEPGWVAVGARFLVRATGQATGIKELGVVQVG